MPPPPIESMALVTGNIYAHGMPVTKQTLAHQHFSYRSPHTGRITANLTPRGKQTTRAPNRAKFAPKPPPFSWHIHRPQSHYRVPPFQAHIRTILLHELWSTFLVSQTDMQALCIIPTQRYTESHVHRKHGLLTIVLSVAQTCIIQLHASFHNLGGIDPKD